MKKTLVKLAAALLVVTAITSSYAGDAKKEGKMAGKVAAVSGDSITINNKKTGEHVIKTDSSTKVLKIDGSAGSVSDVKVGSIVKVQDGTIQLVEPKKKAEGAQKTGGTAEAE